MVAMNSHESYLQILHTIKCAFHLHLNIMILIQNYLFNYLGIEFKFTCVQPGLGPLIQNIKLKTNQV